jgi:hypothetical protein
VGGGRQFLCLFFEEGDTLVEPLTSRHGRPLLKYFNIVPIDYDKSWQLFKLPGRNSYRFSIKNQPHPLIIGILLLLFKSLPETL